MASNGLTEQNTQGADQGETDELFTYTINGRELELKSPGSGAFAMLGKAMGQRKDERKLAGILDFLENRLSDEDAEWLTEGLSRDEVELDDVMEMLEQAMEHWSEDPTMLPSASSSSPTPTGRRSMASSRKKG